ncbi:MAG: 30S ribosomal protein S8, partial [Candidatus Paceibacterota bacterium]
RHGYGHAVLSTPRGVMTGDEARKEKCGGEVLFTIW